MDCLTSVLPRLESPKPSWPVNSLAKLLSLATVATGILSVSACSAATRKSSLLEVLRGSAGTVASLSSVLRSAVLSDAMVVTLSLLL